MAKQNNQRVGKYIYKHYYSNIKPPNIDIDIFSISDFSQTIGYRIKCTANHWETNKNCLKLESCLSAS